MLGIPDLIGVLEVIRRRRWFEPMTFSSGEHHVDRGNLWARGTAVIYAEGTASVEAWENATVYISGRATCIAHDRVKVIGRDNTQANLYDHAQGNIQGPSEFWCYDHSRVVGKNAYLHFYDDSYGTISHCIVDAYDKSKISLLAHSTIHASGNVIIIQGPFVDTSDVVCSQNAALVGAKRLGDGTKKNFGSLSSLKPNSGR